MSGVWADGLLQVVGKSARAGTRNAPGQVAWGIVALAWRGLRRRGRVTWGDYRTGEKAAGISSVFSCRIGRTPVWGGHWPPGLRDSSRMWARVLRRVQGQCRSRREWAQIVAASTPACYARGGARAVKQ
jgi:hypothetical protein